MATSQSCRANRENRQNYRVVQRFLFRHHPPAPLRPRTLDGWFAMMPKVIRVLIILAVAWAAPVQAEDSFAPRLVVAIRNYLQAYEVCLRRVVAASPVAGTKPEHIATTAIKTCREDVAIRATRKRVYGFPSVDNYMAGTDDRIYAFSLQLAEAHIAGLEVR